MALVLASVLAEAGAELVVFLGVCPSCSSSVRCSTWAATSTEITSGSFVFSTPATATSRTANGVSGTFRESSLTYALSRLWSCREAVSHAVT